MYQLLLTILILSQSDTTYKLTDFRLPESGAMEMWVGLDGGFGGYASSDGDDYFHKESHASKDGSGDINFYLERRNERHDFNLSITGGLYGSSDSEVESDYYVYPIEYEVDVGGYTIIDTVAYRFELAHLSESIDKDFSEDLFVTENWMYYPFKRFFFFGVGTSISLDYDRGRGHGWSDDYTDSLPIETDTSWSRSFGMGLNLYPLLGLGRLRPLEFPSRALAVRDILTEELGFEDSPELIQELAELFARRWEYPFKYWHSDWEFYEDIEELLTEYSIPPEDMRIRHWMRIIESSSIWSDGRDYGLRFTFKPSVLTDFSISRSEHTAFEGYTFYSGYKRYRQSTGISIQPGVLVLEGGYPLSNVIQLKGRLRFSPQLFYNLDKDL